MSNKLEMRKIARDLETLVEGTRSASSQNTSGRSGSRHFVMPPDAIKRIQESIRRKTEERENPEDYDYRKKVIKDLEKVSKQFAKDLKDFYDTAHLEAGSGHMGSGLHPGTAINLRLTLRSIVENQYFPSNSKLRKMFQDKIDQGYRYVYTQWMKSYREDLIDAMDVLGVSKLPRNYDQLQSLLEGVPSLRSLPDGSLSVKELRDDLDVMTRDYLRRRVLTFQVIIIVRLNEDGEGGYISMSGDLFKLLRNKLELFNDRIEADTDDQLVRKFKALCDRNIKSMT